MSADSGVGGLNTLPLFDEGPQAFIDFGVRCGVAIVPVTLYLLN